MSKIRPVQVLSALACVMLLTACSLIPSRRVESVASPVPPTPTLDDATALLVAMARVDLAARLDVDVGQVRLQGIEETEFPDASLGVPEPDMSYAQVITPGFIIELVAEGQTFVYHAAGDRVVAAPGADQAEAPVERIAIESVQVTSDLVTVRGTTTLPDDVCVAAELWADGELATWWPADACASLDSGAWEIVVPLEAGQALQPEVQYIVRAFQAGGPDIVATFPFDLAGPPAAASENDPALLLPESAEVVRQVTGDLNGDGSSELVYVAGFGGAPEEMRYDFLRLFVLSSSAAVDAIAGYEIAWQSGTLIGERVENLTLEDINGNGRLEVLCLQSMGASGVALQIAAWDGSQYRLLRPEGGVFDGQDYFGEKGVRLADLDDDGLVEILGGHGPAASETDVYAWDGKGFVYQETRGMDEQLHSGYARLRLADIGMSLEVLRDWLVESPGVWTAPGGGGLRLGVKWIDLVPPQEAEAALLPQPAQILESEPVVLTWGAGRSFTVEVYGEAVEGGGQAPVVSVETHVLVIVDLKGGRRAFDVFVAAPTAAQLAELEDVLSHALATVVLQ